MFGRADNSLSGTDGDESYVEVNNAIEKNPTNIMNLLKSLAERGKSVRILKKGKNCNART